MFAAGHGESGNDLPLFLSTTSAERVDGGWKFTGHKIFGSLSPVWDYLGLHAMDTSNPEAPQIVHAFLQPRRDGLPDRADVGHARDARHREQRHDPRRRVRPRRARRARLPGRLRRRRHVPGRRSSPGACSASPNVYSGIARRAYDLTVERAHQRTSIALTRSMAYHPEVQHYVAEMRMKLELDRRATSTAPRPTGRRASTRPRLAGEDRLDEVHRRHEALRRRRHARSTSPAARASSSATGSSSSSATPAWALIHPANRCSTHELIGKMSLGINPDEQPRWG